eukprot:TRINITY_DN36373_c0_g1_i1.p1 TRINITY_DN36373_c0_g1~~TRINITY_DN36373_c0_g1_i1.p1  ORF type:complete len:842 (-),score=155.27 TRINITY_DN36373_c0_g1_i1:8-2509(-)
MTCRHLPVALALHLAASSELRSWDVAEAMARRKLEELNETERSLLLRGTGWNGWVLMDGFYVGQVPGQPGKHIPWLRMCDSGNGFHNVRAEAVGSTVVWPSPLAVASTWDDASVESLAAAIGQEFKGKGANVILGPAVNVHRVATGGRNWELMSGEDPYLGARLARAYLRGIHKKGVMAVVKHFAFNEQESRRSSESSLVDEKTAWELYYPPFEAAIDEGASSFMCTYNKVNGTYACSNRNLLQRDLRERMGFRGFVMSDWGATHETALESGQDMDMPGNSGLYSPAAVRKYRTSVDESAKRVLAAIYRLRLDEQPPGCTPPDCIVQQDAEVVTEANQMLAKKLTTSSVVLLKNDGILPLTSSRIGKIAVLGDAAMSQAASFWDRRHGFQAGDYYSGGGSGHQPLVNVETSLESIRRRAEAEGIEVVYEGKIVSPMPVDAYIIMAGVTASEHWDRPNLLLEGEAEKLIAEAWKTGKPVIVLLMLPGAVLMPWHQSTSAIATLFYGGEATAHAWSTILFGDESPEGRLPIMMPGSAADTIEPGLGASVSYSEGEFTSYRSKVQNAVFPFGHGLSYTDFDFLDFRAWANQSVWNHHLEVSPSAKPASAPGRQVLDAQAAVTVQISVMNVGSRDGKEVVQAYLSFPKSAGAPSLRLAGFQKTRLLRPGESQLVTLRLCPRDLSVYTRHGAWQVQDDVEVCLGVSSADLRACSFLHAAPKLDEDDTNASADTTTPATHAVALDVATETSAIPETKDSSAIELKERTNSTFDSLSMAAFDVTQVPSHPKAMRHASSSAWASLAIVPIFLVAAIVRASRADTPRGSELQMLMADESDCA